VAPEWSYTGAMGVSLSIKDVPDDLADALRKRALQNHRSIQGELMHILETAVRPRPFRAHELARRIKELGLPSTPNEGTAIIRRNRDRR
jgi:plasmid stability protein